MNATNDPKIQPEDVIDELEFFFNLYESWRKQNGLGHNIKNVFEIFTGMIDKTARIGRYIKHQERKDPKPDWPDGMAECMMGAIVYMHLILKYYGNDIEFNNIRQGFLNELNAAVKQHSK